MNAPFAVPVSGGKNYWTDPPHTQVWALLYAQVTQADGSQNRNLLVTRARARLTDLQFRGRSGNTVYGFAIGPERNAALLELLGFRKTRG